MLRGGLAGQGNRGGKGAIDTVEQLSGWEHFLRRDAGGALVLGTTGDDDGTAVDATPLYLAGYNDTFTATSQIATRAATALQGGSLADALFAVPRVLPPGKVRRLLTACTGNPPAAASGAKIRLGIYSYRNDATAKLFPFELLHDSGDITFESLGVKSAGEISGGLTLNGGLYFFVLTANAAAVAGAANIPAMAENICRPIGGMTVRFGNGEPVYNASLLIGWRHAQAFAALPSTFPSSAPRRLVISTSPTTLSLPAIYFGFDMAG